MRPAQPSKPSNAPRHLSLVFANVFGRVLREPPVREPRVSSESTADAVEVTDVDELTETPHAEVFETRDPRTVRLHLDAGESVPAHQHPDSMVVLYVRSGALELGLGDDTYNLEAGDAVRFDGAQDVSPHALEDAEALVVFAPKLG